MNGGLFLPWRLICSSAMNQLEKLIDVARPFLFRPDFAEREVDYKVELAGKLGEAMIAFRRRTSGAPELLKHALHSKDCNVINWRDKAKFIEWLDRDFVGCSRALTSLWDDSGDVAERIGSFAAALHDQSVSAAGSHLALASTFLMALGATRYPPIRTRVFFRAGAFENLGEMPAAERYRAAIDFLDRFQAAAGKKGMIVESRLVAQGLLWCATGGWGDPASIPTLQPNESDQTGDADIERAMPQFSHVSDTERATLIASRRGQGKFRNALIDFWGRCAVTGCRKVSLLKASHLKPWRESNNQERLDGYNGLLLVPNLDCALDRYLISFSEEGAIILSRSLTSADRDSLGLSKELRLRRVEPGHLPYLRFHRAIFEQWEATYQRKPPKSSDTDVA